MRPILTLLRKDLACFFTDRAAVGMTFLVPTILIYILGNVFGLNGSATPGPSGVTLAVVNESSEAVASELIEALKNEPTFRIRQSQKDEQGIEQPLTEDSVRAAIRNNKYRYALVLPADLVPKDGFGVRLKFISNPQNDIEAQMVNGMLQKTVFSNVPQLLGKSLTETARRHVGQDNYDRFCETVAGAVSGTFGEDREEVLKRMKEGLYLPGSGAKKKASAQITDPTLRRLDPDSDTSEKKKEAKTNDLFSDIISIETEQVVGKDVKNASASRVVGGYAVMFLLFAVGAASISLFEEKKSGILSRMLSTPVTRGHILGAKFLYGTLLGLLQIGTLFLVGHLLYDLELPRHAIPLFVTTLFTAFACSAFGLFVTALAPSTMAAHGLNTLLVLTMSSIGGAWFPVSFMPEFIQHLSRLTLVYWSIDGFISVLWAGKGVLQLLPTLGILTLYTGLLLSVALWRFNRGHLFD